MCNCCIKITIFIFLPFAIYVIRPQLVVSWRRKSLARKSTDRKTHVWKNKQTFFLTLQSYIEAQFIIIHDLQQVKENRIPLEKLCGRQQMKYIFTQNNTVTLVFRSDYTVSGRGFSVQWSAGTLIYCSSSQTCFCLFLSIEDI